MTAAPLVLLAEAGPLVLLEVVLLAEAGPLVLLEVVLLSEAEAEASYSGFRITGACRSKRRASYTWID